MKIIIFGAGGFLGQNLSAYLTEEGHEVMEVKHRSGLFQVDVADASSFSSLSGIPSADVIVNCASILPDATAAYEPAYLQKLFQTNITGGVNILKFAGEKGIRKVINCSSLSVVGKPWPVPIQETDLQLPVGIHAGYGLSKLAQEQLMIELAATLKIELVHLRISSLYGPTMKKEGILPFLINKAINQEAIILTNASSVSFDFLHVMDAARAIGQLIHLKHWEYQIVNLASGEEVYLEQLMADIQKITGSDSQVTTKETAAPFSRAKVATQRLAEMLGGWEARPISEGVMELAKHWKN
jgi:UDP-glucose 4-epimerase